MSAKQKERRPVRAVPPGAVFINRRQLQARYGNISHMTIERKLTGDPDFPRPTFFGAQRFWKISELEAYERACAFAREVTK
jgi:hypothetical protein